MIINNQQNGAQTFTAGITGGLDRADLLLSKEGSPTANVTIQIRTTSAGKPTANVLATGTIAPAAVPTSPASSFVPVTFSPPAAVSAGIQYALVAFAPEPAIPNNWVLWSDQIGTNPYPDGAAFVSSEPPPPGTSWGDPQDSDYAFKTYVTVTPPLQTCDGLAATQSGTVGNDVLFGTTGNDVIVALGGDDVVRGLGGDDIICGGDGADKLKGGAGKDRLFGDAGRDKLRGGNGKDSCVGGTGQDAIGCEKAKQN